VTPISELDETVELPLEAKKQAIDDPGNDLANDYPLTDARPCRLTIAPRSPW